MDPTEEFDLVTQGYRFHVVQVRDWVTGTMSWGGAFVATSKYSYGLSHRGWSVDGSHRAPEHVLQQVKDALDLLEKAEDWGDMTPLEILSKLLPD